MKEAVEDRKETKRPPRFTLPEVPGEEPMFSSEAAEYLGYKPKSFHMLRWRKEITPDLMHRGRPVYYRSSLDKWKTRQTVPVEKAA